MAKQPSKDDAERDVVVWVRLPRKTDISELKKLGIRETACYGGDTCIAAASFDSDAGIVVQGSLKHLMEDSGLTPQMGCFGGNSCIV